MYTLEVTLLDFYTMLPMLILAVGGMALMLIDLVLKPQHKKYGAWLALLALAAAGAGVESPTARVSAGASAVAAASAAAAMSLLFMCNSFQGWCGGTTDQSERRSPAITERRQSWIHPGHRRAWRVAGVVGEEREWAAQLKRTRLP